MNTRKLTALTAIAGILALGEFGTAVMRLQARRLTGRYRRSKKYKVTTLEAAKR